jgi:hypothetical protein
MSLVAGMRADHDVNFMIAAIWGRKMGGQGGLWAGG